MEIVDFTAEFNYICSQMVNFTGEFAPALARVILQFHKLITSKLPKSFKLLLL
jgi:hypothetical protein